MRTPFVPTDPVTAKAIAMHTEIILAEMRAAVALPALEKLYTGFLAYAEKDRVCAQIREHVRGAFNEMALTIKAREKAARIVRDPTGEAA